MLLSEHVTVWLSHSKWLREQSNESASNFALSLNIPPHKLSGWFRRPQLWVPGDWQLHPDNVPAHASRLMQFFGKTLVTQVTKPSYSPDLVPCDFWLFPKLKSSLKRKIFQTIIEIQENRTGQLVVIGRTKVPTLKGQRPLSLYCVQCFLNLLQ